MSDTPQTTDENLEPDFETMSDEDFMNASESSPVETAEAVDPAEPVQAPLVAEEEPPLEEETDPAVVVGSDPGHTTPNQTKASEELPGADQAQEIPAEPTAAAPAEDPAPAVETPAAATETTNFEDAYKEIMAPFKANGREFAPQSADEVKRLMQMGANYTKKMQALKPNLKLMRMLENNGLLDEGKLAYLIDLERKDPAAIQKLMRDGQIDPMDIDTATEPTYKPSNHAVSDAEMALHEKVGDLQSTPTGRETLQIINQQWDQVSKEEVFKDPRIMTLIDGQRANGIYSQISAEVDRQMTLGYLDQNTPFLEAYKTVGDQLHQAGRLTPNAGSQTPVTPSAAPAAAPHVVGTRTATAKQPTANDLKAKAASPARTSPQAPRKEFDPFTMTDDEIMAITSP